MGFKTRGRLKFSNELEQSIHLFVLGLAVIGGLLLLSLGTALVFIQPLFGDLAFGIFSLIFSSAVIISSTSGYAVFKTKS